MVSRAELLQVRSILEKGVASGTFFNEVSGCYCIIGATNKVRHGDDFPESISIDMTEYLDLAKQLGFKSLSDLIIFNDRSSTEEVLNRIDDALETIE